MYGFSYIWDNQESFEYKSYAVLIKKRIEDEFLQKWYISINSSSSLVLYRYFKSTFGYDNYLDYLSNINKKIFVRLRLSSSQLNAVTGRCRNNIRSKICYICNLQDVEDEYHFILICPAYYIIIHTELLVVKIKSCIPRALWGGQYFFNIALAIFF